MAITPNAAVARETIRLLDLEGVAKSGEFFIMQIADLTPAKRVILAHEYRDVCSLATRSGSGDIAPTSASTLELLALHTEVVRRVEAIWHEGSLQSLPDTVSECLLTEQYASASLRRIRKCHLDITATLELARVADDFETDIAATSKDEDDYSTRLHADPDYHEIMEALGAHSRDLDHLVRVIARHLHAVGIETSLRDDGPRIYIAPSPSSSPQVDQLRRALTSASSDLELHSMSSSALSPRPAPDTPTPSAHTNAPHSTLGIQFREPNWLVVAGTPVVCAISTSRLKVLRALIASGGSLSAGAFGKNGSYCLWPTQSYPAGDSPTAHQRRKALEKRLSPTLSRLNADLRLLSLPRSLTARLIKGTVILEVV